jgi:hypothetical protein
MAQNPVSGRSGKGEKKLVNSRLPDVARKRSKYFVLDVIIYAI